MNKEDRAASRRALERDIANLAKQNTIKRVIHALVEECHHLTPKAVDGADQWKNVCFYLRKAEEHAAWLPMDDIDEGPPAPSK